jgi:DNA-binding GntR family transcriptional regulator
VYAVLRRELLLGRYPLIERLAEVRLAEQFGTSRTPVREALVRLESEGLVVRRPEGGFYPLSPNLPDVRDLYQLRRIIELAALTLPRERGHTHDEDILRAVHREWSALATNPPRPDPDFVLVDERFHVALAQAAGNRAVANHLQTVNERIRVVRMHEFIDPVRIEVTGRQHLAIVEELLDAHIDRASQLLAAHLDEALTQASARVAAAIERMVTAGVALAGTRP